MDEIITKGYASRHIEQGSEEWELIRAGRFTSSEIYKIMECGKRSMTPEELAARPKKGKGSATTQVPDPTKMSAAGLTYINQKVSEVLTGQPKKSPYAYPLVYGKEMEPEAVEYFENLHAVKCLTIGFQTWGDHAGGSPDRLLEEVKEGLEIKCPYEPENQTKYLLLTDIYDLKREYPEYYWQVVSLMLFCEIDRWHWCSFDPRMKKEKHKMTHLIFEKAKVEEDMDLVVKALTGAITEKFNLLTTLG